MQLCGSVCRVLILITSVLITVSESADPTVRVKLHESATLPCSERCSGVVRWTEFFKHTEVLAECNQTSCRSVKEGYQMIHDQYLKGDLSLTITAADLSKRARYICDCDDAELCDLHLVVEPLNTPLQMRSGEDLVLDLDISEPVDVLYTGAANRSSGQICTVDGRSVQCEDEYKQKVSVVSVLRLRGVTPSDSGVYTVMDKGNEEAIHTYTVSVQDGGSEGQDQIRNPTRFRRSALSDCPACVCPDQGAALPGWVVAVLAVVVAVLLAAFAVAVRMIYQLRSENQKSLERNVNHVQNRFPMEELGNNGSAEQQRLALLLSF